MKITIYMLLSTLGLVGVASAQSPQIDLESGGGTPQTTVVPVQQTPQKIVERTVVYQESPQGMDRTERRAYKAKLYAAKIDSLVQSGNYLFFPNTMQELPGGMIRMIYADYFYFGFYVEHVEVHLPTERGITQYVEILNFDSMTIRNYQASHLQWGWNVSFCIIDGESGYLVNLAVSSVTGESVLTLMTPAITMRYVGWLWDKDQRHR